MPRRDLQNGPKFFARAGRRKIGNVTEQSAVAEWDFDAAADLDGRSQFDRYQIIKLLAQGQFEGHPRDFWAVTGFPRPG